MHQNQMELDGAGVSDSSRQQSSKVSAVEKVSGMFSTPRGGTISAVILMLAVGFSLFFLNIKPFKAAEAIVNTSDPSITWEQRFGFFEDSITGFPALANYPRLLLLSQVTNNLPGLTPDELTVAIDLIEQQATLGLNDEPESWRMHVAMAHFYQVAAQVDVTLLDKSKVHLNEAEKLAPRTIEVNAIRDEQKRLEEIVAGQ
jgi:hypothetical protein